MFLKGQHVGVTPASLHLKRKDGPLDLSFCKPGFSQVNVRVPRKASKWIAGDFAIALNPYAAQGLDSASQWPLYAAVTLLETVGLDLLTGAAFRFPPAVRAALTPEPGLGASRDDADSAANAVQCPS